MTAEGGWTRAVATVDLAAIEHNVALLVDLSPGAEVMAMVKADAYGHGAVPVARAALRAGATWLGVAYAGEALALRAAGLEGRILVVVMTPDEDLAPLLRADIDISAGAAWAVEAAAEAARHTGIPARLHLEVDTGMARGGARASAWRELVDAAAKARADGLVEVTGVWSHLVHDAPHHPLTRHQTEEFLAAVGLAVAAGLRPAYRHLAKSTAVLHRPDLAFDLVRPGLAVYGLAPDPQGPTARDLGLVPAMSLRARVAHTHRVPRGTGISYGHRDVTLRDTGLALIPLGYGDGIPRAGAGRLSVQLGGRRRGVTGVVCMDQFTVEVGDDEVRPGEEVVLFGPGGHGEPTAEEWAAATGTISYEIVTRIGARVPRQFVGAA